MFFSGMRMTFSFAIKSVAAFALTISASTTFAHITLADQAALAGTYYRATLRVGHGCEGSPTTALRVSIPAGFKGAKPMPKAGWVVAVQTGKLATPFDDHGKLTTEGVTEITWTATPGHALPDAHYDEFVLRGGLPAAAGPMWFKVLQTCAQGRTTDWSEIPTAGQSATSLKLPAALLEIIPSEPVGHAH
jgi:uncharacterized protein YcnI